MAKEGPKFYADHKVEPNRRSRVASGGSEHQRPTVVVQARIEKYQKVIKGWLSALVWMQS